VLTPPAGLPAGALATALARGWGVSAASVEYLPVGWGSHHWDVTDAAGERWFVTADELAGKRLTAGEPLTAGLRRLRAALAAAMDLRDAGLAFVVAPVPARDGEPLAQVAGTFGLAVYPFLDGQSFTWGGPTPPGHRRAVLDMLIAVHTVPRPARRRALADDFTVPHRDVLEAALAAPGGPADWGPYARPAARLIGEHAAPLRRLLARYDALVREARSRPERAVLTHGEPHPGNTLLTEDGWRLIDWDMALIAPPERDLWDLADAPTLAAYADATGVTPLPSLLEAYRLRWDIADIALDLSRFRRPHTGSDDDAKAWRVLRSIVERVSA
jgi:spectinomycin phosphotransferase/16S rRNA (guanine(1405)-N(7))-methyltransferase